MKLWGGRFSGGIDSGAWQLNASISFDRRLALQDVRGSLAWARALGAAGVLSEEECDRICVGLEAIAGEFESQSFEIMETDEDIHTAVERRLGEIIGPAAGKLHTGRSRNDQVVTDLRLWLLDHIPNLEKGIAVLQSSLLWRAEQDYPAIMPGYTHLQRAQPILLSHWWLSHFWPLQRDRQRLSDLQVRTSSLPLGSGALAGTPFPIDREALAAGLGFAQVSPNSIDAVSDRDFAAEFLFCCTMCGLHLSKLAEAMIIYSSAEFGFFELSDAFSTGSSLLPQKKNLDVFELARGKSGTLIGYLTGFLATLKGLPSAYDKDLQEDKLPLFNAYDMMENILPVVAGALKSLAIYPDRMQASIDPSMMAADAADYLVEKGLPFREAHSMVGAAVLLAAGKDKQLSDLTLDEFKSVHGAFDEQVYAVFDPLRSVSRRSVAGGTAPEAVRKQIELAREAMQDGS